MRKKQSSTTAEGMAIMRAIESERPEGKRICYDPYAHAFVGPTYFLSKWYIGSGRYEKAYPGGVGFIVARERYIDDFLRKCLEEGLDQVVILGAGFDTRAYRIPGIEKTRVFEVDHPATRALKLKKLKKVVNPIPDYVTFVPIDFNTQQLDERLRSHGYNEQGKTLFIWQGVTPYLTPEAIDGTLSFIAKHSGPGSAVIFDYFTTERLQSPEMKKIEWLMRLLGEQLTFGIDEGKLESFMIERGFTDVHDATPEELKHLYFTGGNAGRAISPGVNIASARVTKSWENS